MKKKSFFEKIKSNVPVSKEEFPKFFFSAAMLMLIIYVYSILRTSKDSLVVSSMGAELISAIKLYGVLPSAVLFMLLYTKLVDVFSRTTLFHLINGFFVAFFCLFAAVLYPNASSIHFDMSYLITHVPQLKYLFMMLANWSYSMFYILSELYGSVLLSLMFWQLANQITEMDQAKRFYPLFGLVGQIGLFGSGQLGKLFSAGASTDWAQTLNYITLSILCAGLAVSYCLRSITKIVGATEINGAKKSSGKKKVKMGFIESLKYIGSSRTILLITMLILAYGTSINLVEGVWKKALGEVCKTKNEYQEYMADVQIWTAAIAAASMLGGAFFMKRMSWRLAALFTPVVIVVTGALFFVFMIFRDGMAHFIATFGVTAVVLAAFFGAMQNVLSKAVKYAFFDPTKEMAYIPLDADLKSKGKAAADVVGGRLGKSGGAFIQQFALSLFAGSDLISLSPLLFGIFLIVMAIWFVSVVLLAKDIDKVKGTDSKDSGSAQAAA